MPIFKSTDFMHNVNGVFNTEDFAIKADFVYSEIARLIANNKKKIIRALQKSGYQLQKNAPDSAIIDIIVENAGRDERMANNIARLIASGNKTIEISSGAEGDVDWGGIIGGVTGLIGDIFGSSADKKQAAAMVEAQKMALAQQVLAMRSQPKTNPNTKLIIILSGIAIVGLLGLIGFGIYKKRKANVRG